MNKINNLAELQAEIRRLEDVSIRQKDEIKKDLHLLKENLKPVNVITNMISDLTGVNIDKKGFLKDGFAYSISLFIQRFILKTEKKFEKSLYNTVDNLFDKIRHFVTSFSDPEARRRERDDEDDES